MIDLTRGCSRHRRVLIDFLDHGEVGPATGAALAHLDRCAGCTESIESTMLTITALRRLGDEASAVQPRSDAWPRLRVRIQAWRRRPAIMSPLAGIAMSFAIVAVLVLPVRLGGTLIGPVSSEPAIADPAADAHDRAIEDAYISTVHAAAGVVGQGPVSIAFPHIYPDNYHPTRKEVGPAEPNGRPPAAI